MPQVPANTPIGLKYKNIAAAATTVVKSAPGYLGSIIINSASTGTVTLYDNTSAAAPIIGVITVGTAITAPTTLTYGVSFTTGLTIVTSATANVTVLYS